MEAKQPRVIPVGGLVLLGPHSGGWKSRSIMEAEEQHGAEEQHIDAKEATVEQQGDQGATRRPSSPV